MKIRLTVDEAEQIAFALCFCQIELEALAHEPDSDPDSDPEERKKSALAALFYEKMCKRFRNAAEKSKGSVTVDIE